MRYNYSYIMINDDKRIKTEITENFPTEPTLKKYNYIKDQYIEFVEIDFITTRLSFYPEDDSYTLEYFCNQLKKIKSWDYTERFETILDECLNEIYWKFKDRIDCFVFMVVEK